MIKEKKLVQYVVTRWSARFEKMTEANEKGLFDKMQLPMFEQARQILKEVSCQIDIVQGDKANTVDSVNGFEKNKK